MPKHKTYFLKGGLYSTELLEVIAMVAHLGLVTPLELKRYLDGDRQDAYNILCELVKANAPSYRANRS